MDLQAIELIGEYAQGCIILAGAVQITCVFMRCVAYALGGRKNDNNIKNNL